MSRDWVNGTRSVSNSYATMPPAMDEAYIFQSETKSSLLLHRQATKITIYK
jgi:hypothetical protein